MWWESVSGRIFPWLTTTDSLAVPWGICHLLAVLVEDAAAELSWKLCCGLRRVCDMEIWNPQRYKLLESPAPPLPSVPFFRLKILCVRLTGSVLLDQGNRYLVEHVKALMRCCSSVWYPACWTELECPGGIASDNSAIPSWSPAACLQSGSQKQHTVHGFLCAFRASSEFKSFHRWPQPKSECTFAMLNLDDSEHSCEIQIRRSIYFYPSRYCASALIFWQKNKVFTWFSLQRGIRANAFNLWFCKHTVYKYPY